MRDIINNLIKKRENFTSYLQMKIDEKDWHAVADAAMDLREIEAQIKLLEVLVKP